MKSIRVKFWGVRGSIPTPGPSTVRYGGNTACVEIRFADGPLFIMDAGSGIRELGKELLEQNFPVKAYIFISHFHWDHIQGLPFFRPAFNSKNKFKILGSDDTSLKLDQIISFQMDPTYFPIAIEDMRADISFRSLKEERFNIEGVECETLYLNHPGYALGFRFTFREKTVVYISDNEPFQYNEPEEEQENPKRTTKSLEDMFDNFIEDKDERLISFCRDADVLIHDTQFMPEEYRDKITWGHSPYNYTVELALKSDVRDLVLFHHDPDHNDETVEKIQELSCRLIKKHQPLMKCRAAMEGMVIDI